MAAHYNSKVALPAFQSGGDCVTIDIEKVKAARAGDKDCFAQLYDEIALDLYKVALYSLGNTHDAEDVVSETFIEAYKGISKLRDLSSFKAWMMKILSIRCKRKITEYVKGKNSLDIDSFLDLPSDNRDMSSDVAERVTVLENLNRLSQQERMIITLAVVEGYTTREVAEIMSSPHGTISSKLHRALAKLRKMIEQAP